jgi:hypothetical protein
LLQSDAVSVFEVYCRDDQHDLESIRRADRTFIDAVSAYSNYEIVSDVSRRDGTRLYAYATRPAPGYEIG